MDNSNKLLEKYNIDFNTISELILKKYNSLSEWAKTKFFVGTVDIESIIFEDFDGRFDVTIVAPGHSRNKSNHVIWGSFSIGIKKILSNNNIVFRNVSTSGSGKTQNEKIFIYNIEAVNEANRIVNGTESGEQNATKKSLKYVPLTTKNPSLLDPKEKVMKKPKGSQNHKITKEINKNKKKK